MLIEKRCIHNTYCMLTWNCFRRSRSSRRRRSRRSLWIFNPNHRISNLKIVFIIPLIGSETSLWPVLSVCWSFCQFLSLSLQCSYRNTFNLINITLNYLRTSSSVLQLAFSKYIVFCRLEAAFTYYYLYTI